MEMKKWHLLLIVGLSVSALSNAQSKFNFQPIDLPQDSTVWSVNNSGAILCNADQKMHIWTPQLGLTPVVYQPWDKYRLAISDSGKVYGESNGSIIQFNAVTGHKTLLARGAYMYSIVDSNQDNMLIKSKRASQIRYHTLKSGVLSSPLTMPAGFMPSSIGADGVVRGMQGTGTSNSFGAPFEVIAKLNANGTTTVDSRAVSQGSVNSGWDSATTTQTIKSLSDGTVISGQYLYNGYYHSSSYSRNVDIYYPNGSHVQVSAMVHYSSPGVVTQGLRFMMPLKDGRVLGYLCSSPFDLLSDDVAWADRVTSVGGATSVSISDPSVLESGSIAPDKVVAGTFDGVLVGTKKVNNHWVFSLAAPANSQVSRYLRNRA